MKRIEKDIKKNSSKLIESSLPEISALDNIPVKAKKTNDLPLYLIPLGIVAAVTVAIVIPLSLKRPIQGIQSSVSVNPYHPGSGYSYEPYEPGETINPYNPGGNNTNHQYGYDLTGYRPSLNSFNEVAYYSYVAYSGQNGGGVNNMLPSPNRLMKSNDNKEEEGDRTSYVDKYGRTHYPIHVDGPFVFSDFLFFEFDTADNEFLAQRIGNGHIRGLTVKTNIFDEEMLILKNGEDYYSCLCNGSGTANYGAKAYIEFSAHKTIEGFDVVKDFTNKRYLTLEFDGLEEGQRHYDRLSSINIEGETYQINLDSVLYDQVSIACTIEGLREQLELDPDYQYFDEYGGNDELVYDASNEASTFTLDEFEGTFSVSEDKLYFNHDKILDLNGANKIYASEVNKDGHRELVFETYEDAQRMFAIFDVNGNKYLYRKAVTEVNKVYDSYLAMVDDRLTVQLFEPGQTTPEYLVDYGYFAYLGKDGISVAWQNFFQLVTFKLNRVLEADGITLVDSKDKHYDFKSNTPYIIEIAMTKYGVNNQTPFPDENHPIRCEPFDDIQNMSNQSPSWTFLSMENGVYQYQIIFPESGYSYFMISFYRYSFELKAAVDVGLPE